MWPLLTSTPGTHHWQWSSPTVTCAFRPILSEAGIGMCWPHPYQGVTVRWRLESRNELSAGDRTRHSPSKTASVGCSLHGLREHGIKVHTLEPGASLRLFHPTNARGSGEVNLCPESKAQIALCTSSPWRGAQPWSKTSPAAAQGSTVAPELAYAFVSGSILQIFSIRKITEKINKIVRTLKRLESLAGTNPSKQLLELCPS